MGSKLLTCLKWVEEFGRKVADADADYFDVQNPDPTPPPYRAGRSPRRQRREHVAVAEVDRIQSELAKEGI